MATIFFFPFFECLLIDMEKRDRCCRRRRRRRQWSTNFVSFFFLRESADFSEKKPRKQFTTS